MLMFARKYPYPISLLGLFALLIIGCGGGAVRSLDANGPQDSAAVAVGISPQSSAILAGQSIQFTTTGLSGVEVVWSVNGISDGNSSIGTIFRPRANPASNFSSNQSLLDYASCSIGTDRGVLRWRLRP